MPEQNYKKYYKGKNFNFRLKDLEVKEDFKIWTTWGFKGEMKDPDGNLLKFPIKDGVLTTSTGELKDVVNDVKYMKQKDFLMLFPNLNRDTTYRRNIIVDGAEYFFGFKRTAEKKINELIEMCKAMNNDPLQCEFQQVFNRGKTASEMYSVKIVKTGVALVNKSVVAITPREQEVMDAYKGVYQGEYSEVTFVAVATQNGIKEERAKEIYKLL